MHYLTVLVLEKYSIHPLSFIVASPSLTPPAPNGVCDPGWYPFGSHCYLFGVTPRTALDAGFYCQQNQGSLVSIHNASENQFLVTKMKTFNLKDQGFWTGLHKSIDCEYDKGKLQRFYMVKYEVPVLNGLYSGTWL